MRALTIFTLVLWIFFSAGCKHMLDDYELDTHSNPLDSVSLLKYIDQGRDTTLTLYAEAVRYAGAESLLAGEPRTRIVPTNNAIRQLLLNAGVSRIQELSPNLVKDLLSYLVIPGTYKSIDLNEDERVGQVTSRGDSLYITRNVSGTDKYRLYVNNHPMLATPQIAVVGQDYVFQDGIAHIVDEFPIYQRLTKLTDEAPEGVDYSDAQQHTLWIQSDSHVVSAYKNNNYGNGSDLTRSIQLANASWLRYGLMHFNLESIPFKDDIVDASLNVYAFQKSNEAFMPNAGVYETTADWEELEVTWNNMPTFGAEVGSLNLEMGWNVIDITSHIYRAYQAGTEKISLGLKLKDNPGPTGTVFIRSREQEGGQFKAYISLLGALPSELEVQNLSALIVARNSSVVLSKEHIAMTASASSTYNYADNNIIYTMMEEPKSGTLTRYGLPMRQFSEFTQQELENGSIKYVHDGEGNSDLITFKVKDYIGGVLEDYVDLPVTIQ